MLWYAFLTLYICGEKRAGQSQKNEQNVIQMNYEIQFDGNEKIINISSLNKLLSVSEIIVTFLK